MIISGALGTRFHITKYPTLKYVVNGQLAKREYRGQRSADKFVEFVSEQTKENVKEFLDLQELNEMDEKKRFLIGYFEQRDSPDYSVFRRVASNLKDDCIFMAGFGDVSTFKNLGILKRHFRLMKLKVVVFCDFPFRNIMKLRKNKN